MDKIFTKSLDEWIESLAELFSSKPKDMRADINSLTSNWSFAISHAADPDMMLICIVWSYMRGKGYRMGSPKAYKLNSGLAAMLAICISFNAHIGCYSEIKRSNSRLYALNVEAICSEDRSSVLTEAEQILRSMKG